MKGEELPLISEMIKGRPERSMREPVLALFSGLINLAYSWWQYQSIIVTLGYLGTDYGFIGGIILEMMWAMFIIGVFSSLMIMFGGFIMFVFKRKVGGIIALIFSALTIFLGLGFLVGPLLGILGGALALQEKKPPEPGDSSEII